ncbi:hypothetical protein [Litoribacillus peritrichatus]|uniref:Uncharacterized protein n=1 Tax=Litoribacillus peritrichatus TaxID=718191 RepID=A0ABP7LZR1_9GAMM
MIPPKRIIQCLYDHWPTIQALIIRSETGSFTFQVLQGLIRQQNPSFTTDQAFKEAQRIVSSEIAIPLAKSSEYELSQPILEFGQSLLDEHELGLAEEISVLIDDMERLIKKVQASAEDKDAYEVRRYLHRLDDRIRAVIKHFRYNEIAIANLVEKAKSQKSSIRLETRYASVLEAFDQYIEPMLDMLDIYGKFRLTLDYIEEALRQIIQHADTTGQMKREQNTCIHLRTRILELYQIGQHCLRKSTDLLMPLRDELRKNTEVTRAVSKLLANVRKRGIDQRIHAAMPVISTDAARHNLGLHRNIVSYLADVIDIKDEDVVLPDEEQIAPFNPVEIPEFREVFKKLPATQTSDYFEWLKKEYSALPADELLYLYLQVIESDELELTDPADKKEYTFEQMKIIAHSLGGNKLEVNTLEANQQNSQTS